jgi:hypothetical protein
MIKQMQTFSLLIAVFTSTAKSTVLESNSSDVKAVPLINSGNISLGNLTICLRFWVNVYRECTFVEVGLPAGTLNQLSPIFKLGIKNMQKDLNKQTVTLLGQQDFFKISWPQMRWHSICLSYNQPTAQVVLVSNGQMIRKYVDKNLVNLTQGLMTGLQVRIMEKVNGKVADLNIWNNTINGKI